MESIRALSALAVWDRPCVEPVPQVSRPQPRRSIGAFLPRDSRKLWGRPLATIATIVILHLGATTRADTPEVAWFITVATGDTASVAMALNSGADPNARDEEGRSTLAIAAALNPDPAVIRLLVDAGADVNAVGFAESGSSPLSVAARYTPNIAVVTELLAVGADVNQRARDGHTALMSAVTWQPWRHGLPTYFYSRVSVDATSFEGNRFTLAAPIDPAVTFEMVEAFLPDLNMSFSTSVTAVRGSGSEIEVARTPPFAPRLDGIVLATRLFPLAKATSDTRPLAIVQVLVAAGASTNDADDRGSTVLMRAALHGDLQLVTYLLDHGANIEARQDDGASVLHRVIDIDMGRVLVERGARVNARTVSGYTPLHYAAMRETSTPEFTRLLIDAGAEVEAVNDQGFTPLMNAVFYGTSDSIGVLLDAGANARVPEGLQWTMMDLARRNHRLFDATTNQVLDGVFWRLNDAQYD